MSAPTRVRWTDEENSRLWEHTRGRMPDWAKIRKDFFTDRTETAVRSQYYRENRRRRAMASVYDGGLSGGEEERETDPEYTDLTESDGHAELLQSYTTRASNHTGAILAGPSHAGRSLCDTGNSTSSITVQTPTPRVSPIRGQPDPPSEIEQPPIPPTLPGSLPSFRQPQPRHSGSGTAGSGFISLLQPGKVLSPREWLEEQMQPRVQQPPVLIQCVHELDRESQAMSRRLTQLEGDGESTTDRLREQNSAFEDLKRSTNEEVAVLKRKLGEQEGLKRESQAMSRRLTQLEGDGERTTDRLGELSAGVQEQNAAFEDLKRSTNEEIAVLKRKLGEQEGELRELKGLKHDLVALGRKMEEQETNFNVAHRRTDERVNGLSRKLHTGLGTITETMTESIESLRSDILSI
ncbi:hypothetical protein BJX99DRAFT_253249 [Aspergillus californicus]